MTDAERKVAAIQFGKNLRRCRRRVGISQEKLGYLTSLHRTEIGLLERGRREPRLGTVVKLASALQVSLGSLFEGPGWKFERPPSEKPEP